MERLSIPIAAAAMAAALIAARPASSSRASDALRARAADELYNLDHDRAIVTYRQAIAADPQDASAYRGLAGALWISVGFRRGTLTVDNYLGKIGRQDVKLPPPARAVAAEFQQALDSAIRLARTRLLANPRDPDAHYQLGAAIGLRSSYAATVDGGIRRAFSAARDAYDAHEQVLVLDPRRHDAGLIVGTYRYLVAALALPLRWAAYMAGFGGGREKGLQLIEAAAAHPGDNQTDARLALVLLYNREQRYDQALAHLARLRERYPRNRLLWLETGSTYLRAGRTMEAERVLSEGLARLATDTRPRMFGEDALWYYKRGAARAGAGRRLEAEQDLRKALAFQGRNWVQGRIHLELGRLALKAGARPAAHAEFRKAVALCESDNDAPPAAEARALMRD